MGFIFKIIMGGEAAVGKTTMVNRLKTGQFSERLGMTIGVDFQTFHVDYQGKKVTLQVWDLGGQERFRHIFDTYVRGSKAVILMHDLTRPETAEKLNNWLNLFETKDGNLPVILIGTKLDLVQDKKDIEQRKNANIFKIIGERHQLIDHVFISSKTGTNMENILRPICENFQKYGFL